MNARVEPFAYLIPVFVAGFLLFLITVSAVFVVVRGLFLWTSANVTAGIDRVIATAGRPVLTRLQAYALARGMTDEEAARRLTREVDRLAWWTEGLVRLPVLGPVGFDALFGLVPFAGDAFSAWLGLRLVTRGIRFGLPPALVAQLLANVLTDALMGAVPILGDLADIWFRANTRNAKLIRDYLYTRVDANAGVRPPV